MEQNERIATLEAQLEQFAKSLDRIEKKLDNFGTNFITRNEADIQFKNLEDEIKEIKENKKANNAFVVSVFSIVVSGVIGLINLLTK